MEITLAILKPHVVRNVIAFAHIKSILQTNFTILKSKELVLTKEKLNQFYSEHKSKFFYNRLTTLMSSGPSHVLILQSEDCISKWRKLMGPTKVYEAIHTDPECIRAIYGLTDTRNACHGSDSKISAEREISILFPELKSAII